MSGPSLVEVQRWFRQAMAHPPVGDEGMARLAVYTNGYTARTTEALAEVYPAIRWVVGQRRFAALAAEYMAAHPSRSYNLSDVGRHLPTFLPPSPLSRELPFLSDLARLEWAVGLAFHAFEKPPLQAADIAGRPLESLEWARVIWQPSVGVVASEWPILELWKARTTPRNTANVELANRPQRVLVFRRGVAVRCELVTAEQQRVVEALMAGRTLGAVCRELAGSAGEAAPLPLATWFARWAMDGLIVELVEITKGVC